MLNSERLRSLLDYDPDFGEFVWIKNASDRVRIGDVAGTLHGKGYISIRVDGTKYLAHRLAWLWMTGEWPKHQIDHINGQKQDNRWINLRQATPAQNAVNSDLRADNTSGYRGVSWHAKRERWQVYVGKTYVGFFSTIDEAVSAYQAAAKQTYGQFART